MKDQFLPKTRDDALRDLKDHLYSRLRYIKRQLDIKEMEPTTPSSAVSQAHLWSERQFVHDMLDLIERS